MTFKNGYPYCIFHAEVLPNSSHSAYVASYVGIIISALMISHNNYLRWKKNELFTQEEEQPNESSPTILPILQKGRLILENATLAGILAEISKRFIYQTDFDETDESYRIGMIVVGIVLHLRAILGVYEAVSKTELEGGQKMIMLTSSYLALGEGATILSQIFLNLNHSTGNIINIGLAGLNTLISRIAACQIKTQIDQIDQREDEQDSVRDNLSRVSGYSFVESNGVNPINEQSQTLTASLLEYPG